MKPPRKHSVTIRFNDEPATDTDRQFLSKPEMDAYLMGVRDALLDGGYEIIEQKPVAAAG